MNPLVGSKVLWLIPLEEILDDILPATELCRLYHFTPKKLVESLVHEWFRYRLGQGPYQLNQIFKVNSSTAIEEVKQLFMRDEDILLHDLSFKDSSSTDVEYMIEYTGHAVFEAVARYVTSFGVPIDDVRHMEIAGWCHKNLVVRFP